MTDQPIRRAAVYMRASTIHQETDNQLLQVCRFVDAQGWERRELVDYGSGKNAERAKFRELFDLAARREIDVVVFWSLDRFTREGAAATLEYLAKLGSYGVRFHSFTEPYLDSCGVWGDAIISILATIAKQERLRIVERVKAGMDRARVLGTKSGREIGRPRRVFDRNAVIEMRGQGLSYSKIAAELRIGETTARRACA